MGLNNPIAAVRMIPANARIDERRYAPAPIASRNEGRDYRRRRNERLFEAEVTSARIVVGTPEQRCWIERQQVGGSSDANLGGAVVGAIIGGILGHQVGSGRGNDAATAAGAIAGAAIGSGGRGSLPYSRDVRRCENYGNSQPAYWDVTYNFRGSNHYIQMSYPPGPTIVVNGLGEPRQ